MPWSRLAHLLVWAGIALGLGLVVRSSITTGLGTWWIGPAGHQHHMLIIALPFALPILMLVLVLGWSPYVPWVGMLAALALGALALIDRDYVRGYAAIEAGLAAGGLLISVLSLFGRYQAAPEPGR